MTVTQSIYILSDFHSKDIQLVVSCHYQVPRLEAVAEVASKSGLYVSLLNNDDDDDDQVVPLYQPAL